MLPEKFVTDPHEARFGWYRQASGENFFISLKQLLQVEKKFVACLCSSNKFYKVQIVYHWKLVHHWIVHKKKLKNVEDTSDLENFLSYVNMHNLSETECCIAYLISVYIACSISRRRKFQSCRDLLIKNNDMLSLDNFIFDKRVTLLKLADRKKLAVPSDYCFAVCALAVQSYETITSVANTKNILIQYCNQRHAFIQTISNKFETSNFYSSVKKPFVQTNAQKL